MISLDFLAKKFNSFEQVLESKFSSYKDLLTSEEKSTLESTYQSLLKIYGETEDPWGLSVPKAKKSFEILYTIYRHYFKVRLFGKENIKNEQYMVISNHSGQIAIDGLMIGCAFAFENEPPRVLRPMVERFFTALPFINKWSSECGAVLGDRDNCLNLLKRGESLLIFPEGVRGVSKSTTNYYKVQEFTPGFFRMALKSGVKILPVAVVGAEEIFPYVYQASAVAKILKLPALPISANYFPLPSPIDIHVGKPIELPEDIDADSEDSLINPHIREIERVIQSMLTEGRKTRRPWVFSKKMNEDNGDE
ncbi:lysophospholipid acyltransferase family protein [Halobacteriovorax sp. RT-2-4]|uniref:lysophospholipid acyltransferase family protein n=1 Tax=unclassified Halobacteriovorax TaxID=2639665 RepID=UPI003999E3B7